MFGTDIIKACQSSCRGMWHCTNTRFCCTRDIRLVTHCQELVFETIIVRQLNKCPPVNHTTFTYCSRTHINITDDAWKQHVKSAGGNHSNRPWGVQWCIRSELLSVSTEGEAGEAREGPEQGTRSLLPLFLGTKGGVSTLVAHHHHLIQGNLGLPSFLPQTSGNYCVYHIPAQCPHHHQW